MTPFEKELFNVYGLAIDDLHKVADIKFGREIVTTLYIKDCTCMDCVEAQAMDELKAKQKEIIMARKLTRQERIEYAMWNNRIQNKSTLEQSRGYCEVLVDREMAVEAMTKEEASKKIHNKDFVEALEALGLIKFKESEPEGLPLGFKFPYHKFLEWIECVSALRSQGYQITKT